jgi:ACS family pantothenate transporter-like MFS transporter
VAIYYLHYHHSSYFYLVGFLPAPHLLKVINLKYRGFLAFPDVPSRHKPRLLTETDFKLAKSRLEGLTAQLKIPKTIFKRVWGNWHWHFFVAQWCLLDQNSMIAGQPFSLYLKDKSKIYSIRQSTPYLLSLLPYQLCALLAGLFADRSGNSWLPAVLATVPILIGNILLSIWDVGEKGRVAAFVIIGAEGGKF